MPGVVTTKKIRAYATAVVCCLAASACFAQARGPIVLTNAHVLAPDASRFLPNQDLLIDGDRISKIAPAGTMPPDSATKIDCSGSYILPGLIDLHTHLLLHPYDETVWDDQVLRESLELRTIRATVAARKTLEAGFTTIRDLGTEGAGFADVALREAIESGMIVGPRMIVVTRAIVATSCYGPDGFDPRWVLPKGAQEATGPAEVRRVVREQVAAGADWIKVYADYRRRPGASATPTFSQQELDALVDEARSAGLPVVAHATVDEAIRRAVMAGVATIEHGFEASEASFTLMKDRDVIFCPTLAAGEAMVKYAGQPTDVSNHRIARLREVFQHALRSEVSIACGSDAGVFSHGDNARELELMVEFGMTTRQAIASATVTAAKVLRRESEIGKLNAGFAADLIVLRDNPVDDIRALRSPLLVIKAGVVVAKK